MKQSQVSLRQLVIERWNNPKILNGYNKNLSFSGLRKMEEVLIKKYLKLNSKVLDIGCGSGRALLVLSKNYEMYGIDISRGMVALARRNLQRKKLKAKISEMDICSLKYKNDFFDAALFLRNGFEVIPKGAKRLMALNEVFRTLKKGGIFILTTQSVLYPTPKIWLKIIWQYLSNHVLRGIKEFEFGDLVIYDEINVRVYIHFSNPFSIEKMLKDVGFEVFETVSDESKHFPYFSGGLIYYIARK